MLKIVAISGSLRGESSNAALLRAVARVAPAGVQVAIYDGLGRLPHFNPDLDAEDQQPSAAVAELRMLLTGSDGIVISSPEYAHGVPGVMKNLLDWLVSTGELVEKPVALLNASPSGGMYAQASLLETLRTMNWRVVDEGSLVEPFVTRKIVGELTDPAALERLRGAVEALVRAIAKHPVPRAVLPKRDALRAAGGQVRWCDDERLAEENMPGVSPGGYLNRFGWWVIGTTIGGNAIVVNESDPAVYFAGHTTFGADTVAASVQGSLVRLAESPEDFLSRAAGVDALLDRID